MGHFMYPDKKNGVEILFFTPKLLTLPAQPKLKLLALPAPPRLPVLPGPPLLPAKLLAPPWPTLAIHWDGVPFEGGGGGGSVTSVWCHSWVLWQSPDTPVMSCFHVSVRLWARSICALSRLRALFHVGVWCLDPGTHVLSFGLVSGVWTLVSHCLIVSVRSQVRSGTRSSVHVCFVVLHAVRVFIGCEHSCYVLCCVARSLCFSLAACFHVIMSCVNTWLMSFLISCVFVSCFAHGWWFVCWPCACVFLLS